MYIGGNSKVYSVGLLERFSVGYLNGVETEQGRTDRKVRKNKIFDHRDSTMYI